MKRTDVFKTLRSYYDALGDPPTFWGGVGQGIILANVTVLPICIAFLVGRWTA